MAFDLIAAREAGVPDVDIAKSLSAKHGFDLDGALSAGVPVNQIVDSLVTRENTAAPVREAATDPVSAWEKFSYGWDSTDTDVGNWGDYLESRLPIGRITFEGGVPKYLSPDEVYGEGFTQLTPEQRRQRIQTVKQEAVYQDNRNIMQSGFIQEKEDQAWYELDAATAGIFSKTLATPTTLVASPLKWGARGLAMVSGLLTGETMMAQQLAKEGEIKPEELAIGTALGFGGGLVLGKFTQYLSKKIAAKASAKAAQQEVADAAAVVDNIENALIDEVASGTPPADIPTRVTQRLNLQPEEVAAAITKSGRRVFVPSTEEALAAVEARNSAAALSRGGPITDNYFTILSTAVREVSEPVFGRLRKFDFVTHSKKAKLYDEIGGFLKGFDSLSNVNKRAASIALFNGEFDQAGSIIARENPTLVPELDKVKTVLNNFHDELQQVGYRELGYIENYFPRKVKDYRSLTQKLGVPQQTILLKNLKTVGEKLGVKASTIQGYINALPESEVVDVFNKTLRGVVPNKASPGFTKVRSIAQVTDDILDEYEEVPAALLQYINRAVDDVETRRFFGRDSVDKGVRNLDMDQTIGAYIAREMKDGVVNPDSADRLGELLKARFISGNAPSSKIVQAMRNIGYLTTLANPVSALTQIQDLSMSAVVNGFRHSIAAMLSRKAVSVADLGLDNIVAAELGSPTKLAKILDKSLQLSGFKFTDRLGKNTFINSAYRKFSAMSRGDAGTSAIKNKYSKVFGAETDQLINDLRSGAMTDNVKLLLWNELADVQPIALSEMPIKYLQMPNGRLFYSLKTFALRQLDMMRRNIIDEYRKGNKREAARFLGAYFTIVPLMGASVEQLKNAIQGREASLENIPDEYVGNIVKLFGVSDYLAERYLSQGKVSEFVVNTVAPPLGWMDAVATDITKIVEGDTVPEQTLRQLPLGGKIWYQWFGGGIEKDMERAAREK